MLKEKQETNPRDDLNQIASTEQTKQLKSFNKLDPEQNQTSSSKKKESNVSYTFLLFELKAIFDADSLYCTNWIVTHFELFA